MSVDSQVSDLVFVVTNLTCRILSIFFFKQKTAYEVRISDWSSDVCSSDLKDYLKAAANLGAEPSKVFWKVFFPLSLPGLFAGSLIVFILCLGFYIIPVILGGGKVIMVSMRIASTIELFFNWGAASALGVGPLALTLLILYGASLGGR